MFNPNERLMDLKGKQYLQVMWRLVWFRDEKPDWCIDTKLESLSDTHAVFSAKIYDDEGRMKSAGYGSESVKDFRDFIEKAETKAVGRALAMLGYGTQFAPEMDEGERIVDSLVPYTCSRCGNELRARKAGNRVYYPKDIADISKRTYGMKLCWDCMTAEKQKAEAMA